MKLRQIRYVLPLLAFLVVSSYGCSNKNENNPSGTDNPNSATSVKENVSNSESNNKEEASSEKFLSFSVLDESAKNMQCSWL